MDSIVKSVLRIIWNVLCIAINAVVDTVRSTRFDCVTYSHSPGCGILTPVVRQQEKILVQKLYSAAEHLCAALDRSCSVACFAHVRQHHFLVVGGKHLATIHCDAYCRALLQNK